MDSPYQGVVVPWAKFCKHKLSIKFEVQRSAIISNKTFLQSLKAQTSSGSAVKFVGNRVALCLSQCRHRGVFVEILSDKAVGIFIGSSFPRVVWVSKIKSSIGGGFNKLILVKLSAIIGGNSGKQAIKSTHKLNGSPIK